MYGCTRLGDVRMYGCTRLGDVRIYGCIVVHATYKLNVFM
jgi:hypothetical protein